MSNIRYLECERTRDFPASQMRDYALPCPIWCPDDKHTLSGYIDFSDPKANGPGNVDNAGADFVDADDIVSKQTIIDSLGREWFLRPKGDAVIGTWLEGDIYCGRAIWNIDDNFSTQSDVLELLPDHLSTCTPNHVINFSEPWTIYQLVTVFDGQLSFNASPGSNLVLDGAECGPGITITIAKIAGVNINTITVSITDVCGTTRTAPIMRYDNLTCLWLGVSVDPCNHKLSIYAETTEPDQLIWFPYPSHNSPTGNLNSPQLLAEAQSQCFEIDCDDWWIIQREKEYGVETLGSGVSRLTSFFQPPSLWQYFDRLQKVGWNFGSTTSTNVDLFRFQWLNRFRTCLEMARDLSIMTIGKQTITLTASATTFTATDRLVEVTGDGGGNTLATITGPMALEGNQITLLFVDTNVTITNDNSHAADSVDLSASFTSADDATLTIVHDGTSWYEVSRSVN